MRDPFLAAITQHIPDPARRWSATTAGTATRCAVSATGACRRKWFRTARAFRHHHRRAVGGDWSAEAPKGFGRAQEDKADF
ncbi:MAG: hypothetical protein WCT12_22660, partial [Verrucomicrobiota bacterium]